MGDVLIHRCTLRLVRRGGWSWGPDPARLVRQSMRRLPELLAHKLSDLAPEGEDRELSAPVSIRLRVSLTDLLSALESDSAGAAPAFSETPFSRQIESALRAATGLAGQPPASGEDRHTPRSPAPTDAVEESSPPQPRDGALMRLLLFWQESGVLERRLAALSVSILESWCGHLRTVVPIEPDPQNKIEPSEIEAFVRARSSPAAAESRAALLRRRILVAVEAVRHFSATATASLLWPWIDRFLPIDGSQAIASPIPPAPPSPIALEPSISLENPARSRSPETPAAPHRSTTMRAPQPSEWDIAIDSALPFLLLNPLSRLGYLKALDGVLEAAQLASAANLFAAALAHKVLDPPERSWRRSVSSRLSVATFAGQPDDISETALTEFARCIAPHTSPLDLVLADAIIAGHTSGEPVTLYSAPGDSACLLIDTQGCFPIAWISSDADPNQILLKLLRDLGSPLVLVARDAASGSLFRSLHAANVPFLTDAPPTRGESWERASFGPGPSPWTNAQRLLPAASLHRALNEKARAFDDAQRLSAELALRPAATRAASLHLDRSVSLAASVALGTIAWMLWQSRGPTSPQQVLERYAGFDARVRFSPADVRVSLPLGRRYLELHDAGLLATVRGVSWLAGRSIEFTRG